MPKAIIRQRLHLVNGHGARVWYSLSTNVNTPFFQVPTLEFGHGAVPKYKVKTKRGHRHHVCIHFLLVLGQSTAFILAAKLIFENSLWQCEMK